MLFLRIGIEKEEKNERIHIVLQYLGSKNLYDFIVGFRIAAIDERGGGRDGVNDPS